MATHEMLPWQHQTDDEIGFSIDRFCNTSLMTSGWATLTGSSPHETIGKPFADVVHPADRAAVLEALQSLIRGEIYSCRVPSRCLRRDGLYCWVEIYAHPTLDADGRIDGARGTAHQHHRSAQRHARAARERGALSRHQ